MFRTAPPSLSEDSAVELLRLLSLRGRPSLDRNPAGI